jgi:hypothetical protein
MTQIDPPSLQLPGAPTTTIVSGKTATPGPGTLQLTDENGNSYFVDVDANDNYSTTVPQGNFQPVKMMFRTGTLKAAWEIKDGKWTQIAVAVGAPGTQGAMAPSRGTAQATGQQFSLLDDECKQYALVGSLDHGSGLGVAQLGRSPLSPLLLPVRFAGGMTPVHPNPAQPLARLVSDPLPPDAIREAQKQGIDHADQEFEKSQLEKIRNRTPDQQNRLDKLNDMLKDYENAKNNPFANKDAIEIAENAAAARRLQRQAEQMRAAGNAPQADGLDAAARSLMGGQPLPPLRASAQEPLRWPRAPGGTTGAMAPKTPSGGVLAQAPTHIPATGTAVVGQQTTLVIQGTARMSSGVALPKGTFATGAMIYRQETPEEFVKTDELDEFSATLGGPIVKDRLWIWGAYGANKVSPPVTPVGTGGDFKLDYNFGHNYGLGKDLRIGLDYQYKTAISSGYNYGCGKSSSKDLATGTPVPPIVIDDRSQLIKGLMPGANLWQIDETFKKNGLGSVEGWDVSHSPFNPSEFAAYKIAEADVPKFNQIAPRHFSTFGPNFGISTAPVPAWRPENWPDTHPRGIPAARVNRKGWRP